MSSMYRGMTGDVSFREADAWSPRLVPLSAALPVLSLSRSGAYKLIARGKFPLPLVRVGTRWFVRSTDLDALLDQA
jgi:predicted DNA-binding transcriptional regulator AlpA